MMKHTALVTLMIGILGNACVAHAAIIQVDFSGELAGLGASAVGSQFAAGDTVTGQITYDSTVGDSNAGATSSNYDAITDYSVTISTGSGDLNYVSLGADSILFSLGATVHTGQFRSVNVSGPNLTSTNTGPDFMTVLFFDNTLPLTSDALLTDWSVFNDTPEFLINFGISGVTNVRFELDSFRVGTVPEPGTLALLGLGLVGMAARRRSKA